ncbi:MAG: sialidase family protein [Thermoplasmatota archaeon]
MRWTTLAVLGLLVLAGCLDFGKSRPPPPTTTSSGAMVFQADGETVVPVPLPAAFGSGMRVASVSTGFHGAEPNVGITAKGNVFVSAYESILRSTDEGGTWVEVHHMGLGQTFDPMLWVDVPTGRVYSIHIYPDKTCSTLIYSDDADVAQPTWREIPLRCPSLVVDHEKLATGPPAGALAPVGGLMPFPRLVSLCYNKLSSTHCAMSLDGGLSYPMDNQVDATPGGAAPGTPANCGGLNGHQTHGSDGTIYLPYGYDCRKGRLAVSTDGGVTWTRHAFDEAELELDPEVTVTPDGTAYYLYRGTDQAMHILRSTDRFASHDGPFRVSPPEVKGTVFAGLTSGSDGRIAVAYLGTTDTDAGPDDAGPATVWNLYAGMSLDAGAAAPTFVTVRVNPADDPVQRGAICHSKECKAGDRNLLDFIDLSVGPDGRFWASFADGCTSAACRTAGQRDAATSRDDTATVAWLLDGPSLLKEKGHVTARQP